MLVKFMDARRTGVERLLGVPSAESSEQIDPLVASSKTLQIDETPIARLFTAIRFIANTKLERSCDLRNGGAGTTIALHRNLPTQCSVIDQHRF